MKNLFSLCLAENEIHEEREDSPTILMYKEDDPQDLENFRTISLLYTAKKFFSRMGSDEDVFVV